MNDVNQEPDLIDVDTTDIVLAGDSCESPESLSELHLDPRATADETGLSKKRTPAERAPEHWLNRIRVILWGPHQVLIARMLVVALLMMTLFFSYRWYIENGLVDIDEASSIRAEFKVDINSAELGEIVVLPGIGPKLGQAILDHRQSEGGFKSHDDLCNVPGIGEKTLESLKPHLMPLQPAGPIK